MKNDLDHRAMNQDLALRLQWESLSSGRAQLGRPSVEAGIVFRLCWGILAVGENSLKRFQPEPLSMIWIHRLSPVRIQSSKGLIVC